MRITGDMSESAKQKQIKEGVEKERLRCKCGDKMIVSGSGLKICGPGCAKCRHYDHYCGMDSF